MCPWRNWHRCQMLLPGQTLRKRSWSVQFHFPMPTSLPEIQHPGPGSPAPCRDICMAYAICSSSVILLKSGRPVWPNSCWLMVIFSRASSESAKRKRWQGRADGMSHTGPPTNWFLSCQTPPMPTPVSTASTEHPWPQDCRLHLLYLQSQGWQSQPQQQRLQPPAVPPPPAAAAALP